MFDRYTESARRVLFFARYEASHFGVGAIRPEHVLLGLIREPKGLVHQILARSHVSLETIRRDIEAALGRDEEIPTSVEVPFSDDAKRTLQAAGEQADSLRHDDIGTEHLLLGLLDVRGSVAETLLTRLGVRADEVRRMIAELRGGSE